MEHHLHKEKDLQTFQHQLNNFPHSFDMNEEIDDLSNKKLQHVLQKLLLRGKFIDKKDEIRIKNFSSFLLYKTELTDDAYAKNDEILESDANNIVALANRAEMLYRDDLYLEANRYVKRLKAMEGSIEFQYLKTNARAEIAYSYARTVPKFYIMSAEMYKDVNKQYPNEYLWQYGEAQVLRRCFTKYSQNSNVDFSKIVLRTRYLLEKIATCKDAGIVLNAKALTELGELYTMLKHKNLPFSKDVLCKVLTKTPLQSPSGCYRQALELGTSDAYVLERYGRHCRNVGDLGRSKELLEKAISTEESGFSHHHLAKTLLEIAAKPLSSSDEYVKDAIWHCKKSLELTKGFNVEAEFDLGEIHQQIGNYDQAIKHFRKILNSQSFVTGPIDAIKAYEQIGLCYLEKLRDSGSEVDIEQSKVYLTKAVEVISALINNIPTLTKAALQSWKAFPTLIQMLKSEYSNTKKSRIIKKNAHLHTLVGKHKESLDILEEFCRIFPNEADNPDVRKEMIQNCIGLKQYDNAFMLLKQTLCTKARECITNEFVFSVCLQTAYHNLKGGKLQNAQACFLYAFEYKHGRNMNPNAWDVMLLYDACHWQEEADFLCSILETNCGLRVSKNVETAFGGKLEPDTYVEFMEGSKTLIVLLGNHPPSRELVRYINIAVYCCYSLDENSLRVIVPVKIGAADEVDSLKAFRSRQMSSPPPEGEHAMIWLKDFFAALLDTECEREVQA